MRARPKPQNQIREVIIVLCALAGLNVSFSPAATSMAPLWSISTEDEQAPMWGYIADLKWDAAGNLLVVDSKYSTITEISKSGEVLSFSEIAGEGPGEVSHPAGIVTFQGCQRLIRSLPAQLVSRCEGQQEHGAVLRLAPMDREEGDQAIPIMTGIQQAGGRLFASWRLFSFSQHATTYSISEISAEGRELVRYCSLGAGVGEEAKEDDIPPFAQNQLWAAGDHQVFCVPDRNAYRISVYNLDGPLSHEIQEDRTPALRSEREMRRAQFVPGTGVTSQSVSKYRPAILSIHVVGDMLLVSESQEDREEHALVFRRYARSGAPMDDLLLEFPEEVSEDRDRIYFVDENRVVVIYGAGDSLKYGFEESEGSESRPLRLVLYASE